MKNDIFNTMRQQFFIVKKVSKSCETIEQLQCCNDWLNRLNDNWLTMAEQEMSSLRFGKKVSFSIKYSDITKEFIEDWNTHIQTIQNEIEPPEEPIYYKKPIVVKGFQHTDTL